MEEGTFIGWLKKHGDAVQAGEPLFTLEGEKATQDIEATEGGLLQLSDGSPRPGDTVKVGAVLALLLEENAADARPTPHPQPEPPKAISTKPPNPDPKAHPPVPMRNPTPSPGPIPTAPVSVRISPRAARRAIAMGVAWKALRGTGRTGRIRERDVLTAASGPPVATEDAHAAQHPQQRDLAPQLSGRLIPMSPARRAIARRLSNSAHGAVPVTLTSQIDATQLVRFRAKLKENALGISTPAPTFQDILVRLVGQALGEHPILNAQWRENGLFFPDAIHIAIAVDTEDGLLAPVLRDVRGMTLDRIADTSRRLIEQARARRLQTVDLEGGTFTITNLGGLGIDAFTPVLNPPQCAILGMGRIRKQTGGIANDMVVRETLTLSLTFDHRIVDGAPAARFLETLSRLIMNVDT